MDLDSCSMRDRCPVPGRAFKRPPARGADAVSSRPNGRAWQLAAVVALLLLQSGCYHYHVFSLPRDPATDYERETVVAYFWGLMQPDTAAEDCVSGALNEVKVSTNFAYLVASVATLGVVVPLEVSWRCAKEPPVDGEI